MRQVLSLSLPSQEVKQIKKIVKARGYVSVSSYVKYLLKNDEQIISDIQLLKTVRAAQKEYAQGKSIKAKSIADLL